MIKKHYSVSVDNPCMQEWSSMEQSDKGKYCLHCAKSVIDFTQLSDQQAMQEIERSAGNLCGRFRPDQLNRSLSSHSSANSAPLYKFLTGLLLIGASKQMVAKTDIGIKQNIVSMNLSSEFQLLETQSEPTSDSTRNTVSGVVVDGSTKEKLPFAYITLKNTNIATTTDLNGAFNLIIPDSLLNDELNLIVSFVGFRSKELQLNKNELPINKEILLVEMDTDIIGVVVVIEKKRWWQFWK